MESLADCQVSLPLDGLLRLVPQFTKKVVTLIVQNGIEQLSVNYSNPVTGPTIMDEHSSSIKVVKRGQEIPIAS